MEKKFTAEDLLELLDFLATFYPNERLSADELDARATKWAEIRKKHFKIIWDKWREIDPFNQSDLNDFANWLNLGIE